MSDNTTELPRLIFTQAGSEVDLDSARGMLRRQIRKMLMKEGEKAQKKFGHLVHPETGERPDVVIMLPEKGKLNFRIMLKTDSEKLRDWLKGQGIVIEDISPGAPKSDAVVEAPQAPEAA